MHNETSERIEVIERTGLLSNQVAKSKAGQSMGCLDSHVPLGRRPLHETEQKL